MIEQFKLCACGCGQNVFPPDRKGRTKRFIWGHNSKTGKSIYSSKTTKQCACCHKDLPLDSFYHSGIKVSARCKNCLRGYYKSRFSLLSDSEVKERNREAAARYKNLKAEIIKEYGGKCECCGESLLEFLSIDHIHGGGTKHRKRVGSGGFFWEMRKEGYPKDKYRILCMNCNFARGRFGYCPHERIKI